MPACSPSPFRSPLGRHRRRLFFFFLWMVLAGPAPLLAEEGREESRGGFFGGEWTGFASVENRIFFEDPSNPIQYEHHNVSVSLQPEYDTEWQGGRYQLRFVPFLRVDQHDEERTHFDLRELLWQTSGESWELRLGIGKVFWGVTESVHLVDIVNQSDFVENLDAEDKLGQPMVNFAWVTENFGTVDFFFLPGFRERTFPGPEARLQLPFVVNENRAVFESDLKEGSLDATVRWAHSYEMFDWGLSYFFGTSREPQLIPDIPNSQFIPQYDLIHQVGLDAQATTGSMLWKFEGIYRAGQGKDFVAGAGGFEYTFTGLFGTGADLGVIGEYIRDERENLAFTITKDDFFGGLRLAVNDVQSTEFLGGAIVDRESGAVLVSGEGSRRVGENWKILVEGRAFLNTDSSDPADFFRNEHFIQIEIQRYF